MLTRGDSDRWSVACAAARVVEMTHGFSRGIASNNYISERPLLGVRKWCKMLQMKGRGGGRLEVVEAVLILMQQIAVKDLEILGNIRKRVVYTTIGGVWRSTEKGTGLKRKEGLRNGVKRADGHDM
jgi:hypothetical protein